MKTIEYAVIIPLFNEEKNLPELYTRLSEVMRHQGARYELIFVNDGSTDSTAAILEEYGKTDGAAKMISLSRNFGHQNAVLAGLHHASATKAVIVMDGDLQDPPEVIAQFIKKWEEGYKVVYGIRTKRKESFLLRTAYTLFYWMLKKWASIDIPVDAGDFCLMDKDVVEIICGFSEQIRFIRGVRAWVGFKQTGVEYERCKRFAGKSKYSFRALCQLAVEGFYSFSALPIHIIFWFSLILAFFSFAGIIALIIAKLCFLYEVPGWTSLFVGMLFFGSVQMMAISIVGEYCGKIFEESKKRPGYIVASYINVQ